MAKFKKGDLVRLKGDWVRDDEYYGPMLVIDVMFRTKQEGQWVTCLRAGETILYTALQLDKIKDKE
jgi:hypothetical protein